MMLTVSYREAGQAESKVFVAQKITYIGREGEFALYNVDDEIEIYIKPVRLEVQSIADAPKT